MTKVKKPILPEVRLEPKTHRLMQDAEKFYGELEQRWNKAKQNEVVSIHDLLAITLTGKNRYSVLVAIDLYRKNLIDEIHANLEKQYSSKEDKPSELETPKTNEPRKDKDQSSVTVT